MKNEELKHKLDEVTVHRDALQKQIDQMGGAIGDLRELISVLEAQRDENATRSAQLQVALNKASRALQSMQQ